MTEEKDRVVIYDGLDFASPICGFDYDKIIENGYSYGNKQNQANYLRWVIRKFHIKFAGNEAKKNQHYLRLMKEGFLEKIVATITEYENWKDPKAKKIIDSSLPENFAELKQIKIILPKIVWFEKKEQLVFVFKWLVNNNFIEKKFKDKMKNWINNCFVLKNNRAVFKNLKNEKIEKILWEKPLTELIFFVEWILDFGVYEKIEHTEKWVENYFLYKKPNGKIQNINPDSYYKIKMADIETIDGLKKPKGIKDKLFEEFKKELKELNN